MLRQIPQEQLDKDTVEMMEKLKSRSNKYKGQWSDVLNKKFCASIEKYGTKWKKIAKLLGKSVL